MDKLTKIFNFEVKQVGPESDRTLRFCGSDETPDRDNDIVRVAGWQTDNYMKNPVFLWAHRYDVPPVGKCVNLIKDTANKKLMFDIKFPTIDELSSDVKNPAEHAKFVDMIYNMYKNKYLNATSVGFSGTKFKRRDDDSVLSLPEWQRGTEFIEQELLELSGCPVPANPNALQSAKSKGLINDIQIKSFFMPEHKALTKANKPDYKGTESISWQKVVKTFVVYRDAYYKSEGNKPDDEDDIPSSVKDAPADMKKWIASKTLLGDPKANSTDDLIFFPVVNPSTNKLNEGALKAVLSGRGQQADVSDDVYKSASDMAKKLLKDEFNINTDDDNNDDDKSFNADVKVYMCDDQKAQKLLDIAKKYIKDFGIEGKRIVIDGKEADVYIESTKGESILFGFDHINDPNAAIKIPLSLLKTGARLSKESLDTLKGINDILENAVSDHHKAHKDAMDTYKDCMNRMDKGEDWDDVKDDMEDAIDCQQKAHKKAIRSYKACVKSFIEFMGGDDDSDTTGGGSDTGFNPTVDNSSGVSTQNGGTSDGVEVPKSMEGLLKTILGRLDNMEKSQKQNDNEAEIDLESIDVPRATKDAGKDELDIKPEDIAKLIQQSVKNAVDSAVNAAKGKIQ